MDAYESVRQQLFSLGINLALQLFFVGLMEDSQAPLEVSDDDEIEIETNQQRFCGLQTISANEASGLVVFDDPVLPSFSLAKPVDSTDVNFPELESLEREMEEQPPQPSQIHDGANDTNHAEAAACDERPVDRKLNFDKCVEEVPDDDEPKKSEDVAESKVPADQDGDEQASETEADPDVTESKEPADQDGDERASKKRTALDDLENPKFAKGARLSGLSPSSQERLKEVRKLRAIQNSDQWRAKWNAKGVPKECHPESESAKAASKAVSPAGSPTAAAAEIRESPTAAAAAAPADAEPRPKTLNDARVLGQQMIFDPLACILYRMELGIELSTCPPEFVQAAYIGKFMTEKKGTPECNLSNANKAWMASDERSAMVAGRKGKVQMG